MEVQGPPSPVTSQQGGTAWRGPMGTPQDGEWDRGHPTSSESLLHTLEHLGKSHILTQAGHSG